MPSLTSKGTFSKFYSLIPILILFISVLNEFDFNYLNLEYFSFNFPFILIFFFSLKDFKYFDYFLVFIAGLINDTVVGLPLGISSLSYMIICISTSYLRNITIRPHPIKDWFFFLFIISIVNSINYLILSLIFLINVDYIQYAINTFFTFIFYFPLTYFFNVYVNFSSRSFNV